MAGRLRFVPARPILNVCERHGESLQRQCPRPCRDERLGKPGMEIERWGRRAMSGKGPGMRRTLRATSRPSGSSVLGVGRLARNPSFTPDRAPA
jgi:hypothetical protein